MTGTGERAAFKAFRPRLSGTDIKVHWAAVHACGPWRWFCWETVFGMAEPATGHGWRSRHTATGCGA